MHVIFQVFQVTWNFMQNYKPYYLCCEDCALYLQQNNSVMQINKRLKTNVTLNFM